MRLSPAANFACALCSSFVANLDSATDWAKGLAKSLGVLPGAKADDAVHPLTGVATGLPGAAPTQTPRTVIAAMLHASENDLMLWNSPTPALAPSVAASPAQALSRRRLLRRRRAAPR